MRLFSHGLRARLLLLIVFAVIPGIALNAYTAVNQRQRAAENAAIEAVNIVTSVSREVERSSRIEQPPYANRVLFLSPLSYGIGNLEPFVLDLSILRRNYNVEQEGRGSRGERDR